MKFSTLSIVAFASSTQAIKVTRDSGNRDDPICSSAGCDQYKHPKGGPGYPMDYPVPNFGMDHDIIGTKASIKQAEGSVEHTWTPT